MHRTNHFLKLGACGLLCAGLARGTGGTPVAHSQEPVPPPAAGAAAQPGQAPKALVVPITGTAKLSMTPKRPIRRVLNEKDTIARVQATSDDTGTVVVTGLQAGSTRVTLTDVNGVSEVVEVIVQFDIDTLKSVLKRAVPTASVDAIPAGTNTIILVGNVAHPEDVEVILRVAQGVLVSGGAQGGGPAAAPQGATVSANIVNAMSVGGVKQVQLDCVIAQVNRTKLRQFGVNFTEHLGQYAFGSTIGNLTTVGQQSAGGGGGGTTILGPIAFLNSLTPGSSTNLTAALGPPGLNLFVQALKAEGLAKLLAEPKLVALSGRPATFTSGGDQAVPEVAASGGTGVVGSRFEPFGTQLTYLAIVLNNGKIYLEVTPAVTSLNQANGFISAGIAVAGRDRQSVSTSVILEAGQTLAIGGLIQTIVSGQTNKTPVIGELPFIGPAFSTVQYQEQERELVVLVTPYLIDPMDCKQVPCKLPGTETRSPDDFELFLELIVEAPRGQREVFPNKHYRPAYLNDPTASQLPCGGGCANGTCGAAGGCATGNCGGPTGAPPVIQNGGPAPQADAAPPANLPPAGTPTAGIRPSGVTRMSGASAGVPPG